MSIKIQPDATVCRYLFTAKSLYMFRVSQHPLSAVLTTVTATSGIGHNIGTATSHQRGRSHCSVVSNAEFRTESRMSASVDQRETRRCIAARHVPECLSRKAFHFSIFV